jgi:hypothetical protein
MSRALERGLAERFHFHDRAKSASDDSLEAWVRAARPHQFTDDHAVLPARTRSRATPR